MADEKDSISKDDLDVQLDNPSVESAPKKKKSIYEVTENPYEKYKKFKDPVASRYRKKMLANFLVSASIIAIIIIVFIAYIGSMVGNYTIELQRDQRVLSISEEPYFTDRNTRLRAESVKSSYALSYDDLPPDDDLDGIHYDDDGNIVGSHNDTTEVKGTFMAYTFYLKNVSDINVWYYYNIRIEGINKTTVKNASEFGIEEVIRYKLYRNTVIFNDDKTDVPLAEQTHDYEVFAKSTAQTYVNEAGETVPLPRIISEGEDLGVVVDDPREYVGSSEIEYHKDGSGHNDLTRPIGRRCIGISNDIATDFYDDEYVVYNSRHIIKQDEVIRFTIVIWIEGGDIECTGVVPSGSGIQFSMQIIAEVNDNGQPDTPSGGSGDDVSLLNLENEKEKLFFTNLQ